MTTLRSFSLCSRKQRLFLSLAVIVTGKLLRHKRISNPCATVTRIASLSPSENYKDGDDCKKYDIHLTVHGADPCVTIGGIDPGIEVETPDRWSVCVWAKDKVVKATRTCEAGDKEDPVDVTSPPVQLDARSNVAASSTWLVDSQMRPLFASKCGATNPKSVTPNANTHGVAPREVHRSKAPTPSAATKHTTPTPSSDEAPKPTEAAAEGHRRKAPTPSASTKHTVPPPSSDKAPTPSGAPPISTNETGSSSKTKVDSTANTKVLVTKQKKRGRAKNGKTKKKEENAAAPGPCCL